MEWNLKIPKIFHVYWGGGKLNYLRFMTIKTFMKYNPDWEIIYLYPSQSTKQTTWGTYENKNECFLCKDFTSELFNLPVTRKEIDFEKYGISNDIPEVHKSDFIRLIQLTQYGGLWSDMDILYIRPMNDFYLNFENNKNIETFLCNNLYGYSVGFMMSTKENPFFQTLWDAAIKEYNPRLYQTIGSTLYNKYFPTIESVNNIVTAKNFSMSVVYPNVAGYEENFINGNNIGINDLTLGVHWYAGHPQWKEFFLKTNGGLINLPNCAIGKILKNES